jgi:mannosyl-oligosaccharide glucosidase
MTVSDTRHACDQGDGLQSYTFTEHDGRTAAVQVIKDAENNVELKTELLKIPGGDAGEQLRLASDGNF